MIVSCRVEGPSGAVRELSALLDFNSRYCVMFARDAMDIGFQETGNRPREWQSLYPDRAPFLLGLRGIERAILITLKSVGLGSLVAHDVDAVTMEMEPSRLLPFDVVLGRSFLDNFKMVYDGRRGYLSLE